MLTASESRSTIVSPLSHHQTHESNFTLPKLETVQVALPFRIALRCAEMLLETLCDVVAVTELRASNLGKQQDNLKKQKNNLFDSSNDNFDNNEDDVDAKQNSLFLSNLAGVIDLSWFAACMARFASTRSVVLCTRLFLRALEASSTLRNDVLPNLASVVEILSPHWHNDQLMLMLLTMSIRVDEQFFDLYEFESGNDSNSLQRNRKQKHEREEQIQVNTPPSSSSLHLHSVNDESREQNNVINDNTNYSRKPFNVEEMLEKEYEVLQKFVDRRLDATQIATLHPFITPLLLKMFALRLHNSSTTHLTVLQSKAPSSSFHFQSERPLRLCFRLRRALSAVRVCCRMMCVIAHKRYCKSIRKVMNHVTSSTLMSVDRFLQCDDHKESKQIELHTYDKPEENKKQEISSNNNNYHHNQQNEKNSLEGESSNEHTQEENERYYETSSEMNTSSSRRRCQRVF